VIVVLVTVAVVLPFLDGLKGGNKAQSVEDYPGPGEGTVEIVVHEGDGGAAIAKTLKQAAVVATEDAFIKAYQANARSLSIQPGTYRMALRMKAESAVAALLDEANRVVVKFTIPEGYRADQVYEVIHQKTDIAVADLEAAAADAAAIGLPPEAKGDVEGWLFPATYALNPNPTAVDALSAMVSRMVDELETLGVERKKWRKTVILASVVEKESKLSADRPKVARVFLNRNKAHMRWQSDATVSYGVKKFDSVFVTGQDQSDDNKWNTYMRDGYPGGAICNPGEEALNGAINPAKGKWLYFVAVNLETGETKYADDAAGHQANINEMCQWINEHPGPWEPC
jgi:UPF0755 protein